jgi:hypothetical protein
MCCLRRPATTQRLRDHYDRYYSSSEESNEYSQTEVDEPQVAHSLHEDRLDVADPSSVLLSTRQCGHIP